VAYACLAETIVLALEGRFENFTVGRAIEWEKVREIYKMGLKHGMKLAAISGVNGPFSDEDIARVRELALAARAKQAAAHKRGAAKSADAGEAEPGKKPARARRAAKPAKSSKAAESSASPTAAGKRPTRRASAARPDAARSLSEAPPPVRRATRKRGARAAQN
jgi:hypothetical protein